MRVIDETPIKFQINLFSFVTYCFWLIKEILKSNIAVTKTILSPQIKIKQNMFDVPLSPKTSGGTRFLGGRRYPKTSGEPGF